jgi:hypothetical protein
MGPGDWVIVALPYPPSALPFTVSDGRITLTQASSYASLNSTTYFYDSTAEHLYLMHAGSIQDIIYFSKWVRFSSLMKKINLLREILSPVVLQEHSVSPPSVLTVYLLTWPFLLPSLRQKLKKDTPLICRHVNKTSPNLTTVKEKHSSSSSHLLRSSHMPSTTI